MNLSDEPGSSYESALEPRYPTGAPVVPPSEVPLAPATEPGRRREGPWAALKYAPATYALLAINLGVFLWMVRSGVSVTSPTEAQLIHWGANNPVLVIFHGQWWRIVSAMFVHVGLLHLATNMWCLWNLGLLGEPLLGFFGMIAVYLLTGAAGNLLSLGWNVIHNNAWEVGAGASGAVFGIAGILIVLLSNRRLAEPRPGRPGIPWFELRKLRKSVIQFAALNLVIGLGTIFAGPIRIDNSAHLGGFVCGLAMGVPLMSQMTAGRGPYLSRQRVVFSGFAFLLVLIGYAISHMR